MKLKRTYTDDTDGNPFGQWFKTAISARYSGEKDTNPTQATIAQHLGVSAAEVSSLKRGYHMPSSAVLEKIFKGLRVDESGKAEARRIIKAGRDQEMRARPWEGFQDSDVQDEPPAAGDQVYPPGLVTVRRAFLDETLRKIRSATGKDKRIFELYGHVGDGRDHFVRALTDAALEADRQSSRNSRVLSISFQGFWLRSVAFSNEEQVTQEAIAEEILFQLGYPSPRVHGRAPSLEDYIRSLVDYFSPCANAKTQHILSLYDLRPEYFRMSYDQGEKIKRFETSLLTLLGEVVERVPCLRIVLAVPHFVYNAAVDPHGMQRLDASDLQILAESLVPDTPEIWRHIGDMATQGCTPLYITVDQWALVMGKIRDRLKGPEGQAAEIVGAIWDEETKRFPDHKLSDEDLLGYNLDDKITLSAVRHYYDSLLPGEKAVLYVSLLFPGDFTVGDVRRLFQLSYPGHADFRLPIDQREGQDVDWWKERGRIREALHRLARMGWLQSETRLTADATSFHLRPSLSIYLRALSDKRYSGPDEGRLPDDELQIGFCRSLIEALEDLFERDILSHRQATDVRERIDSLYKAMAFARGAKDRDLLVSLSRHLCQFYSAEASWHLSLMCLNSLIGPVLHKDRTVRDREKLKLFPMENDAARRQLYRLRFLQLSHSYHSDEYGVTLEQDLRRPLLETEAQEAADQFLAELGHYHLFEVRRHNLIADPSAHNQARDHALKAVEYLQRAVSYFAGCRGAAVGESASGADGVTSVQSGLHAEVRDLSKALAKAYYWKARTEAQMGTDWRTDPREWQRVRELFLEAIAFAQDTEARREHVFCYIWLARIDLLYRGEVQEPETDVGPS